MPMTPGEADRLLLHLQASLAMRRRDRGLRLNVPEARSLIADAVCEWARDGRSLPEVVALAGTLLTADDVLPGVPGALPEVRVEGRFDDGTRLVVVKEPFGTGPRTMVEPGRSAPTGAGTGSDGEYLDIANEATTAIGLTSHIHLAEVNPRLRLDRERAFGMRLSIATGDTTWLGPGQSARLPIRPIAGDRVVVGNTGVVDGPLDDPGVRERGLAMLRECGYLDVVDGSPVGSADNAETAVASLVRRRREHQ